MGKGLSKFETSPLVSMCKERKKFIKSAIYGRYDIISAYVMYLDTLLGLGNALNQYVQDELVIIDDDTSQDSDFDSGSDCDPSDVASHIEFQYSDDSEVEDLHSLTDHVPDGMQVQKQPNIENQYHYATNMSVNNHVNLMHDDPAQIVNNQRFPLWENPQSFQRDPQLVNQGLPGSSIGVSYYGDRYLYHPTEPISMAVPSSFPKFHKHEADQKPSSIAPPPPPPPPQASAWDFSYLFGFNDVNDCKSVNFSYNYYTWSDISDSDVREIREREGIPDLEEATDTELDGERLRRGNLNSGDGTSSAAQISSHRDAFIDEEEAPKARCNITEKEIKVDSEVLASKILEPRIMESESSDAEEKMVASSKSLGTSCVSSPVCRCKVGLKEAIQEIKDEFQNLFNFGKEFSETIEVGKLLYNSMSTRLRGFASPVLRLIYPSVLKCSHLPPRIQLDQITRKGQILCSITKTNNKELVLAKFSDLSSTLEQLYAWEKRLCKEVMGEEKLRIVYDKGYKRLKDLDGHGAESDKIDGVWASVRHMESEINVAVASIRAVSREIEDLRDQKLLPELNILIEGLVKLWEYMSSCHRKQFKIIVRAKSHVHIFDPCRNHSNPLATLRLEGLIINWGTCFSNLVNTLKGFVKYLHEWLQRCLLQEPEKTVNGKTNTPFSPSSIGGPPIFDLCHDWYHSIDSISETGVSKAFSSFASSLHHLYEKQTEEQTQKARVDCLFMDYEDRLTFLYQKNEMSFEHDFTSIMAAVRDNVEADIPLLEEGLDEILTTLGNRLVEQRAEHREVIRQLNDTASSCLQVGLSHIFEVLESYCLENLKAYELLRIPYSASHA